MTASIPGNCGTACGDWKFPNSRAAPGVEQLSATLSAPDALVLQAFHVRSRPAAAGAPK